MREIELNIGGEVSKIMIGESIENISNFTPANCIVITDKNVNSFYGNYFNKYPIIEIEPGEGSKCLRTVENICRELIELKADRDTFILGIGGGVVTDITGFVASIFKRGLKFGYISTTLLGQVDASIGGKNGINFNGLKNMLGTINQPEFIVSDLNLLKTLPESELRNGLAEIIKTALINDNDFFEFIKTNYKKAICLDIEILEEMVFRSVRIKGNIVHEDERENNIRRLLNFGHTFGHAIESVSKLSHGESIAIGMIKALEISFGEFNLNMDVLDSVRKLLVEIGLPVEREYDKGKVLDAIINDKKMFNNTMKFVLLRDIGKAEILEIEIDEIRRYL